MRFFSKRGKILVLVIIGIILVLSLNFFQKEVKGFFYAVSSPIQKRFFGAGESVAGFFESIINLKSLKTENDEFKSTIVTLLAENAYLKELAKENKTLREALQIGLQKDFQLTLAEVTGKDIGQESILINQGTRSGLSLGMPVVTQQKVLLGRIAEVYENFSRVTLISNKESSFDAQVSGKDVAGVAKGQGSSRIVFDLVPQQESLEADDLVISSALGGIYPAGLLVGSVKNIERDDVSPFYRAEIAPFFDIQKIKTVFVILNLIND